ncbi:LPS-assembly protein LptD [Palleronia sp. LCG004]|uniref:LPS-assembly protein LptD n=1 Tax=Palleronia sp. LCG004 TaxID=3079304 RepID=UPI00294367FA|nr:LPS assembly protein LptD [Palleronia sp. LCG004]WOI55205.1 LPS assembly protein LptD [Palleronia sp. LCG004]
MRAICLSLALALAPLSGTAQELATLVADELRVEGDDVLVAAGSVEVLYGETRLEAAGIVYDQSTDRISVTGPITLEEGDQILVLADQAELDADLADGILRSARLVLDRQLQLAATQIARVEGRYTQLSNTVASSCEICAANPTPTWEIRARRVIHDEQERLLYFDNATFRLLGVPVAYFPRLRLPDPTLSRSSGFLIPRLRTTSRLGTGFKIPYFQTLGSHADVTLSPYLSGSTSTLETTYRQTFPNGALRFDAAITRDDLLPDETRHYVFARGAFDLPRGFQLEFDVEQVSDESYLIDYGYADTDRLETGVRIFRARAKDLFNASIVSFDTLRGAEGAISDRLPSYYGTVDYQRATPFAQGEVVLDVNAATLSRSSTIDGAGRDVSRLGMGLSYRRDWITRTGIAGEAEAGIAGALYTIHNDSRFGSEAARLTPYASVDLRLPLQRSSAGGVRELIEPMVQLAWSDVTGDAVPNEDSILAEFDEGNLMALSRFPGDDRIETGARANVGVRFTRTSPEGWTLGAVAGRVFRTTSENDLDGGASDSTGGFTRGSGLGGKSSDWLAAAQVRLGERIAFTGRTLFDDELELTKNEARLGYLGERLALETAYVFLDGEPAENRPRDTHELTLEGEWRLSRHWIGKFDTRYDFDVDRAQRSGLGLEYRSECISVDMSLSRRFTQTDIVDPATEFGITVALAGFGDSRVDETFRKRCDG